MPLIHILVMFTLAKAAQEREDEIVELFLETKDEEFIKLFARELVKLFPEGFIPLATKILREAKIKNGIDCLKSWIMNNLEYLYYSDANELITILANTIIDMHNLKNIYLFITKFENVSKDVMNNLSDMVIKTDIPEFIYLIAKTCELDTEYKDRLVAALIKLNNPKFIGYASLYIDGISEEMEKLLGSAVANLTDYSWARKPNPKLHEELKEKLLNSDDSIENPFAPIEEEKRMNLVKPEGNV